MSKNRLLFAVILLAVLGGALVATMRSRAPETTAAPEASLPTADREKLTWIEISPPGKDKLVLEKKEDAWRLTAPLASEVDQASVDTILDKLANLEPAGIAATRPENHARLEVDAEHAIRVKAKEGDALVVDLLIGASKSGGTMVRKEGDDTVVATQGTIRYAFDKESKDLRNRTITDLDTGDVTSLELKSDKGSFKFEKAESAWTQAKGEKPIKDFSGTKVQGIASTLARLRAVDFAPPGATPEATGLDAPKATAVLTKKDGSSITLTLGNLHEGNNDYYLKSSERDLVYRVVKFTGERMMPDATAFEESKSAGEPPAGGRVPIAGGGNLPPEVLKQLQGLNHP